MDTVLLVVTVLSLVTAMVMAVIVVRLLREERARSEARVIALAALAAQPAADVPVTPPPVSRPAPVTSAPAPPARRLDDLEIRPETPSVAGVSHLFEERVERSPWGRRFAVIGVLGSLVLAISLLMVWTRPRASASTSQADAAAQPPAVLDGAPLELVSLRHTQAPQQLVISGLVQNPRSGAPMSHVVATAFVFAPDGAFLTSSRAPLDFTTLAPGDESAFVINVPVTGQVARYRIGFRTEDGRVIEHVDKRAPDALAQK